MAAGFQAEDFWKLTPRMYLLQMEAFGKRSKREIEDRITVAWMNAAFQRAEKLPKLDKLFRHKTEIRDDAYIAANLAALRRRFTK